MADRATYLEPFQYSQGITTVLVNGQLVLENGEPTGAEPGRALEGSRHGRRSLSSRRGSEERKKPASEPIPNDYLSLSRSEPSQLAG